MKQKKESFKHSICVGSIRFQIYEICIQKFISR